MGRGGLGVPRSDENVLDSLEASYENGVTDEFFVPTSFDGRGMQDGDAAVFFNFRPDRARELTRAIVDAEFDGFDRERRPEVSFVCLTECDPLLTPLSHFPRNSLPTSWPMPWPMRTCASTISLKRRNMRM
ncbi:MAG: hypothetical protein ACLRX5_09175 [Slackia sp.]